MLESPGETLVPMENSFRLPDHCSVFQAKKLAVIEATAKQIETRYFNFQPQTGSNKSLGSLTLNSN